VKEKQWQRKESCIKEKKDSMRGPFDHNSEGKLYFINWGASATTEIRPEILAEWLRRKGPDDGEVRRNALSRAKYPSRMATALWKMERF